jgi:hypothetical protein
MTDRREGPMLRERCVCGWETIEELELAVDAAIEHGRSVHNMTATREVVLASAEWIDPTTVSGERA